MVSALHLPQADTPDQQHEHRWENHPGLPLLCGACGELWPAEPDWPPEPFSCRNAGYGALEGFVPWGDRVNRMLNELDEVMS